MNELPVLYLAGSALAGACIGYLLRRWTAVKSKASIEAKARELLEEAKRAAKEKTLEAEEKAAKIIAASAAEEKERKTELRRLEERLTGKEDTLEKQRAQFEAERERLKMEEKRLAGAEGEAKALQDRAVKELERVSGLSREEARAALLKELEETGRADMAERLARLEREKRDEVEKRAQDVIVTALQRYARTSIADVTTSVIQLQNEDIKGKIIGKEGRNIKAFERLTGVEVVVDETPDSILLSSFDPVRRELARLALEKLIKDGRIQPAKIEEKVEEARQEIDAQIRKAGEEAAYEVGVLDLPKEILAVLGRLNYRTSYGQNVLAHSVEMTHIAGMIAAELGLNVEVAKKGALVHDIGKAIDQEAEGTHVEIGRKLLKKYNVDERAICAMEAHHDEYPYAIPEAYVVAAADAVSSARPGARRDTLEKYIKRIEEIERVVSGFEGVQQAYAIAAGREVRVFAKPEKIDDFGALQLAKEIANKIQSDVNYPGEVKVTVVREVKAVEYAR